MLTNDQKSKLWDLISPIKSGMLVTNNEGHLQSRPMHLVQSDFDGILYFFTELTSEKVSEIKNDNLVNLSFSSPSKQIYVSISASAEITQDTSLIEKFWNPFVAAWFPQGKHDASVGLIALTCYRAEYWQGDNKIIQLFDYANALLKGRKPKMGKHEEM